jgi:hypothetical protein
MRHYTQSGKLFIINDTAYHTLYSQSAKLRLTGMPQ